MTFVRALSPVCRTDVMAAKLKALADGLHHKDEDVYVIGRVGNGIRASQAVAAALWAFLRYGKTPEECIDPGRGLRRRHGHHRRDGRGPGGRVARQLVDSGPLVRQHREWRPWAG